MGNINIGGVIDWLIKSLNPDINIFFAISIIVITQIIKAWLPKLKNDRVLIIPASLSLLPAGVHLLLGDITAPQIPATILIYIALSAGGYKILSTFLPKLFKSKEKIEKEKSIAQG